MSRVAIVSSGPSLAARPVLPLREYASVIGVNYAISAYPCGLWAASDSPVIHETDPLVAPETLFTRRDQWDRLARNHPETAERYTPIAKFTEDVTIPEFIDRKWRLYTIGTAVVLAWSLGAREIDVYGHDMTGTGDIRGPVGRSENRTSARWDQERRIWDLLTERLERDGIVVRRVAA